MTFSRFRSIRPRLAAIAAAAAVPMALIIGFNAALTYSSVKSALTMVPESSATALRQAMQTSFGGAARVGMTTAESVLALGVDKCGALLAPLLERNVGYVAIRVETTSGSCLKVRAADEADQKRIAEIFARPADGAPAFQPPEAGGKIWVETTSGSATPATFVRASFGEGPSQATAWVMLGPDLLKRVVDAVDTRIPGVVSLVDARGAPLLAKDHDEKWLPVGDVGRLAGRQPVTLRGMDGEERQYVVTPLAANNMYVVSALSASGARDLAMQIAVALIVPLATLLLIALAYSRTMKTAVIDWIEALDKVAQRSATDSGVRAVISPKMPTELATVASSLNDMLDKRQARESALSGALAHNQYLARELHHRVKNSLQLVQSYLSLGARDASPQAKPALVGAQARAYLLSAAYRRALAEGEMVAVDIDPFLDDVASFAAGLMADGGRQALWAFETGRQTSIDEAIPLGMIIVELLEYGLADHANRRVEISLAPQGERLRLEAKGQSARFTPDSRLFKGLLRQVNATQVPTDAAEFVATLRLSDRVVSVLKASP